MQQRPGVRHKTVAELQVFLMDTTGLAAVPAQWWRLLPQQERQRINALRRTQDRVNRGMGWAALIALAAERLQLEPGDISVRRNASGKPELQLPRGTRPLHVSLSHASSHVVLALASQPVGVDLERVEAADHALLRRHYFPADPLPPAGNELQQLYALWTAKEALLKATGVGLRLPLERIVLKPPARQFQPALRVPAGHALESCQVASLPLPAPWVGAVALQCAGSRYRCRRHGHSCSACNRLMQVRLNASVDYMQLRTILV